MNKRDFLVSTIFNSVSLLLFIEHLFNLEAALPCFIGWSMISLIVHIVIFRNYAKILIIKEEV